jgi:hypothetical protein
MQATNADPGLRLGSKLFWTTQYPSRGDGKAQFYGKRASVELTKVLGEIGQNFKA